MSKRKLVETIDPGRTLVVSNYKFFYSRQSAPDTLEELLDALDQFVEAYFGIFYEEEMLRCSRILDYRLSVREEIMSEYNDSIKEEGDKQEALNKAAQKMWTTDSTLGKEAKVFSMINEAIRLDHGRLMRPLAKLSRAVNNLCLYRDDDFPPKGLCFRGGGMMPTHRDFFVEGKMYRVPGFLATSFSNDVANDFIEKAVGRGEEPILWTVRLDERGADDTDHRCLHVGLLRAQEYGEKEFLFVPYSTFTVETVQWSRRPSLACPHRITIFAANDNRAAPEDLPLAPWF